MAAAAAAPGVDGVARPLLALESVSKVYGRGEAAVKALSEVSCAVEEGEFVAVVGPSGSGKSTLMHIIGCLDSPTSGEYWFAGEDVSRMSEYQLAGVRNRRIGFVFQQFHLLSMMSAWRNVELPLLYRSARDRRKSAASLAYAGSDSPVADRELVTFLARPRKVTKRRPPLVSRPFSGVPLRCLTR